MSCNATKHLPDQHQDRSSCVYIDTHPAKLFRQMPRNHSRARAHGKPLVAETSLRELDNTPVQGVVTHTSICTNHRRPGSSYSNEQTQSQNEDRTILKTASPFFKNIRSCTERLFPSAKKEMSTEPHDTTPNQPQDGGSNGIGEENGFP